jgi:hypothetical protein
VKNSTQAMHKFFDTAWHIKIWKAIVALVWVAVLAAPSAIGPTPLALAEAEGRGHTVDVTFTKWVTSPPVNYPSFAGVSMAGVVGGAVGEGRYAGKVLSDDLSVPGFWLAHARYEFYGEEHSFIADVRVTENDTTSPATAAITGIVTTGWLKGAHLTGEYTVMPLCPIATPGNVAGTLCFQGTLHIQRGHGSGE